jgi:hypothetical protein
MQLQGASVAAEDVEGGVALRFTTSGDVAELRRRVATRAAMHAQMHAGAGMGRGPGAGRGPARPEMMVSDAKAEEVDDGSRVVFMPRDPTRLDALRAEVRAHAADLATRRSCPRMMTGARQGR